MNKEDWEEMYNNSIFMHLQKLRNMGVAHENKDEILGIERLNMTGFVENTDGFIEVCNGKDELLGVIYKYKPWNKWVWEQDIGVIMSSNCLKDVSQYLERLNNKKECKSLNKMICPNCDGKGIVFYEDGCHMHEDECWVCNGSGEKEGEKE